MPAGSDRLTSGEKLRLGQRVVSSNGQFRLTLQTDGNLVVTRKVGTFPSKPLWSSKTKGKPSNYLAMQADGNLVLRDANGKPIWSSKSDNNPGARLVMQSDGNAVVYQANRALFSTKTVQKALPALSGASGDRIRPGETLARGEHLRSSSSEFRLQLQTDGNLVLTRRYPPGYSPKPLWATNTLGHLSYACAMQTDGNFVIVDANGEPVWSTATNGSKGVHGVVQNDGNFVFYDVDNNPVYATGTVQKTRPGGPPAERSRIRKGQLLRLEERLVSENGLFRLTLQSDGNLVLRKDNPLTSTSTPVWSSRTDGDRSYGLKMQADGNLVLYDVDGDPIWSSDSHGTEGETCHLQDDGNVVVHDNKGSVVFATGTNVEVPPFQAPTASGAEMRAGEVLKRGDRLNSPSQSYTLVHQHDGNVVLYKRSAGAGRSLALWSTRTNNTSSHVFCFLSTGRLAHYAESWATMWDIGPFKGADRLVLQDDGNLVLRSQNNSSLWSAGTSVNERNAPRGGTREREIEDPRPAAGVLALESLVANNTWNDDTFTIWERTRGDKVVAEVGPSAQQVLLVPEDKYARYFAVSHQWAAEEGLDPKDQGALSFRSRVVRSESILLFGDKNDSYLVWNI